MLCIKNVDVFDGKDIVKNKHVIVEETQIKDIVSSSKKTQTEFEIDASQCILAPGFIDLQVNGAHGLFFNTDPTVNTIKKISQTHAQFGTTSLLPTLITDTYEKLKLSLAAVTEAVHTHSVAGILGVHLEGPYINPQKRGIHSADRIRVPSQEEIDLICSAQIPILVTLAPELMERVVIEKLSKHGVFVFAGHSYATGEQMKEAFDSGVVGVTHLFNACSQLSSREIGVVGAALLNENAWCGIIVDGFHVSYDTLRVAFKARGTSKFILVSDAMPAVGSDIKSFFIDSQKINVDHGKCTDEHGTLAGALLTIHWAFQNTMKNKLAPLRESLAMTSAHAAECMKVDHKKGRIVPGFDADLVLLNKETFDLVHVIQNGVVVK